MYEYTNEELKDCLRTIMVLWKRKVTPLDVKVCEELFLDFSFDPEAVQYLLKFVKMRGADSIKYVYPIADALKKTGITDSTEIELTLEKTFKKYTDILMYINHSKMVPSVAEKKKIDEIIHEFDPSADEIKMIGEITRRAKRPSLQYFEAVLRNKREQR